MQDELLRLLSFTPVGPMKIETYLIRLLSTIVLSTIAAISYSFLQRKERTRISNLPYTMVLYSVMVCGLMLIIGESVAKAFGLLGALSLVRFRLALKNPTDMAAILFTVTIGITCGIFLPSVALLFTLLVLSIFFLMHLFHESKFNLMRQLAIEGSSKTIRRFLKELEAKFQVSITIGSPENLGKNAAWNATVKFPNHHKLREWEAWLRGEETILYSFDKYEISIALTDWTVSEKAAVAEAT